MLRREVAISHVAGILAGAGATVLGPILPVLSRSWSLSDAEGGALLACEFMGGFCGAIASGWLGARQALTTLLAAGLALLALGFAGAALMAKPWMPLCLFGCGLGLGFINPVANLVVSRANLPSPAAALNLFSFSWAAGALATPSVVAVCLRHEPVAGVFGELATLAAAAAVLASMGIAGGSRELASAAPRAGEGTHSGTGWFIAISGALLFLYVGVETSVSVWLPTGAARWAAVTASAGAATQSTFWAALLMGRLLAPVWLRRVQPRTLILAGLLSGGAGVGLLLAACGYRSLLVGAVLAGLGLAPVNPTIVATFTTRLGSAAARWTGLVFASAGLGGAAVPWVVGAMSSHFTSLRIGFAAPLFSIGCMFCLELALGTRPFGLTSQTSSG
jgi:fucose permease